MNKSGPIIVIEDDKDDQELLSMVFEELNYHNRVIFFDDGVSAYEYLVSSKEHPFVIISDINMHKMSGFELRDQIHKNELLRLKCIPYLFFTTASDEKNVIDAYSKSVQGFFTKPNEYSEILRVIGTIFKYWEECHSPNITV